MKGANSYLLASHFKQCSGYFVVQNSALSRESQSGGTARAGVGENVSGGQCDAEFSELRGKLVKALRRNAVETEVSGTARCISIEQRRL